MRIRKIAKQFHLKSLSFNILLKQVDCEFKDKRGG